VTNARLNLPNAITAARIVVAPVIALLPFSASPYLRLLAFVLFVTAAVTDIYDGWLARSRNMVTDLGRLLDPLADKLLLLATFIPMFVLMAPRDDPLALLLGISADWSRLPFIAPFGEVGLPWWVVAIIMAREIFMTVFRQVAHQRGVVISANAPAKWKTGFQSTWVGASYFWFFAATLNQMGGWPAGWWMPVSVFVGLVGVTAMVGAVAMTVISLWIYLTTFGRVLRG
jgi:phosphatidylglycerophosphate synthase